MARGFTHLVSHRVQHLGKRLRPHTMTATCLPRHRLDFLEKRRHGDTSSALDHPMLALENQAHGARRISRSVTRTPRVDDPPADVEGHATQASSPPAVLSEQGGQLVNFNDAPGLNAAQWGMTGEFSGQQPTTSVRGETAFRYKPMPPIKPPPPTATNTASSCGQLLFEFDGDSSLPRHNIAVVVGRYKDATPLFDSSAACRQFRAQRVFASGMQACTQGLNPPGFSGARRANEPIPSAAIPRAFEAAATQSPWFPIARRNDARRRLLRRQQGDLV